MGTEQWRIGRNYDIHVYAIDQEDSPDGDRPVATFHRPADAYRAVSAVNSPTEAEIVQRMCAALNVPYECPDGHGMRQATLDEALSWVAGQREVRDELLRHTEQVDPNWLTVYRSGSSQTEERDV